MSTLPCPKSASNNVYSFIHSGRMDTRAAVVVGVCALGFVLLPLWDFGLTYELAPVVAEVLAVPEPAMAGSDGALWLPCS